MKSFEELIKLFKNITKNIFCKYSPKRLLDESDYFEAYLHFLDNSIYYSRFTYTINGKTIKGKYLNEKVNKWNNLGIFNKMHKKILDEYLKLESANIKHMAIDSQFIRNRFMPTKRVGRNKFYKNKNGLKFTTIVDDNGTPLTISLDNGKIYDSKLLISICDKMLTDINLTFNNKQYLLADSGYDSNKNTEYIKKQKLIPIIKQNIRKTKDKQKIKKKKFTKKEQKIYNKRIIVENFFSWKDLIIPRTDKIYDKKISNFFGMMLIMTSDIILNKMRLKESK